METRDELLKNALTHFYREGYEKTGIRKIVASCGVCKPTLYYHFKSKRGLLESVLEHYFSNFQESLTGAAVYEGDIVKSLESIARLYFDFAMEQPKFYQFYLGIIHSPPKSETQSVVLPYLKRQWQQIGELFTFATEHHGNMEGRARRYTLTFIGMINSYITAYYLGESRLDGDEAFEACRQFMHGIFS